MLAVDAQGGCQNGSDQQADHCATWINMVVASNDRTTPPTNDEWALRIQGRRLNIQSHDENHHALAWVDLYTCLKPT